jgi:cystathionine beta-lyase/cystathionine gamma-synthase
MEMLENTPKTEAKDLSLERNSRENIAAPTAPRVVNGEDLIYINGKYQAIAEFVAGVNAMYLERTGKIEDLEARLRSASQHADAVSQILDKQRKKIEAIRGTTMENA